MFSPWEIVDRQTDPSREKRLYCTKCIVKTFFSHQRIHWWLTADKKQHLFLTSRLARLVQWLPFITIFLMMQIPTQLSKIYWLEGSIDFLYFLCLLFFERPQPAKWITTKLCIYFSIRDNNEILRCTRHACADAHVSLWNVHMRFSLINAITFPIISHRKLCSMTS